MISRSARPARVFTCALAAVALALSAPGGQLRAAALAPDWTPSEIETIPIDSNISRPTIASYGSTTFSLSVGSIPQNGSSYYVLTDRSDLINAPSSWPHTLSYSYGGSTTKSFTITANAVQSTTQVHLYTCRTTLDPTDSDNWRDAGTLTITPN
jgi:hypothetical protein